MNTEKPSAITPLFEEQIAALRIALLSKFPTNQYVLGAQLGAFVRNQLPSDINLKTTFGGLKKFISTHFPKEISLRGKRGMDDLYTVSFFPNDGQCPLKSVPQEITQNSTPSSRDIVRKAIEFLSPEELDQLCLPLGAVAKALRTLSKE